MGQDRGFCFIFFKLFQILHFIFDQNRNNFQSKFNERNSSLIFLLFKFIPKILLMSTADFHVTHFDLYESSVLNVDHCYYSIMLKCKARAHKHSDHIITVRVSSIIIKQS